MRYELFNRTFQLKWMPIKAFKELPFKVYSKIYSEHGYVNSPFYSEGNSLNNSYLRSAGTGIDFVLYHDFVFRYEYSINHLGQKGLYLHEIGHAIGLVHEHQLPDRDKYIEILYHNVQPNMRIWFNKYSSQEVNQMDVKYEYSSVMHYGITVS